MSVQTESPTTTPPPEGLREQVHEAARRARVAARILGTLSAETKNAPTPNASGTSDKPTLMLLDGNSLAFRAFYALPAENFKTQGGLTTNAVYGFTSMLINLLRDEQPSHVAAAFDVSRQTFRKDKYPEYKEGRSATPDEFRGQIDITKEVLGALGITALAEPGFEADDIIATLATQAEQEATGCWWSPVTGTRCNW
ncbi:DNA polymerase I [Mycolicibacterium conceptionense]|uniref:5'-3' exonuclease n=1 Tax=Mycolicibacterium conceptionense TaxID=451644 RepID=A0A0U1DXJ3_9MYCO|nr:DNA polymerase I [Mycolicibacterium conceptionense]